MKKFLMIMGGIFLVFVLILAVAVGFLMTKGLSLDAESKKYVEKMLPDFLPAMTPEKFYSYVHPEDQGKLDKQQVEKYLTAFRAGLGEYQSSLSGVRCNANVNITPQGTGTTADCIAEAGFKNGVAKIKILLLRREDAWSLARIDFFSDALLPNGEAK